MVYTMVVEQTKDYPKRMIYDPEARSFRESEYDSLAHVRGFTRPYGWIKESGTPPGPHWDVILMTDRDFALGQELPVKVIGVLLRGDGDHKYIAVEESRAVDDFSQLSGGEREELRRFYPRLGPGEGWFGRAEAEKAMIECEKAL